MTCTHMLIFQGEKVEEYKLEPDEKWIVQAEFVAPTGGCKDFKNTMQWNTSQNHLKYRKFKLALTSYCW